MTAEPLTAVRSNAWSEGRVAIILSLRVLPGVFNVKIDLMTSRELLTSWNRTDDKGSIQPPLSGAEVDALTNHEIYPDTVIEYGRYRDMARTALIVCSHIRLPDSPELTAEALATFK